MNTNGSVTLSQSKLDNIRQVLVKFAEGKVSIPQIQVELRNYFSINFDDSPSHRKINVTHLMDLGDLVQVPMDTKYLSNSLQRYIADDTTKSELSDWAAFIFLSELYIPIGETEEECLRAGEGVLWDILQKLMTPEVFGGLNHNIARQYLDELSDDTAPARSS